MICITKGDEYTFGALFIKVFIPCFSWGTGTALGEIPPYLVALAKAKAGEANSEIEEAEKARNQGAGYNVIKQLEIWTLSIIERYGWFAVFLLSAWPNAAFDMCGICCGAFQMPFWSFFLGVWTGKACVKVMLQAIFFILLFSDHFLNLFLNFIKNYLSVSIHETISQTLHSQRNKLANPDHDADEGLSLLSWLWSWIIVLFVTYFALSCIESVANATYKDLKEREKYQ